MLVKYDSMTAAFVKQNCKFCRQDSFSVVLHYNHSSVIFMNACVLQMVLLVEFCPLCLLLLCVFE